MSVIGHFWYPSLIETQIVLFKFVKFEQGMNPLGQTFEFEAGLVTLTKGVPVGEPQTLVPLN